jgi:acyl carrier protein
VSEDEIKSIVLGEIAKIAPEFDSKLDPEADLREQIDLDSMDMLNLMIAIHEATGVEIPEADYPQLSTLDTCVAYLKVRMNKS